MVHVPDPIRDMPEDDVPESAPVACPETPLAAPRRLPASGSAAPPADAPKPIGMDRLRALREAIRNGTYPTQADVVGGIVRMFGEPEAVPEAEEEVP